MVEKSNMKYWLCARRHNKCKVLKVPVTFLQYFFQFSRSYDARCTVHRALCSFHLINNNASIFWTPQNWCDSNFLLKSTLATWKLKLKWFNINRMMRVLRILLSWPISISSCVRVTSTVEFYQCVKNGIIDIRHARKSEFHSIISLLWPRTRSCQKKKTTITCHFRIDKI